MTDQEQTQLIDKLREIAGMQTCYDKDPHYDAYDETRPITQIVEDAEDYGMINLARTLLECLEIEYV